MLCIELQQSLLQDKAVKKKEMMDHIEIFSGNNKECKGIEKISLVLF
jgi:hypothetical protein